MNTGPPLPKNEWRNDLSQQDFQEKEREKFFSQMGIKKPKSKKDKYRIRRMYARWKPAGGEAHAS